MMGFSVIAVLWLKDLPWKLAVNAVKEIFQISVQKLQY